MKGMKKAAGCVDTQTAFKTDSKGDFIPFLARMKAALYLIAAWLSAVGGVL